MPVAQPFRNDDVEAAAKGFRGRKAEDPLGKARDPVLGNNQRNRPLGRRRHHEHRLCLDRPQRQIQPLTLQVGQRRMGTPLDRAGRTQFRRTHHGPPSLPVRLHTGQKRFHIAVISLPDPGGSLGVVIHEVLAEIRLELSGILLVSSFLELLEVLLRGPGCRPRAQGRSDARQQDHNHVSGVHIAPL